MYEKGVRRDGETFVEGLPRSTLRNLERKLTFVPAGHEYHEWHEPQGRTMRLMHFYFDPSHLFRSMPES
jgi:AraC family transcriptional regulator